MSGRVNVKGVKLFNTGLTFCNYFHIVTNVFIVLLLIGLIIYFINIKNNYIKTKGIIVSIKYDNVEYFKNTQKIRLVVKYNIINKNIVSYLDYSGNSEQYLINEKIDILYNKYNNYDIIFNKPITLILSISIIGLLMTIVGTYLRLYHSDNSLIQFWIGTSCFKTFFSNN